MTPTPATVDTYTLTRQSIAELRVTLLRRESDRLARLIERRCRELARITDTLTRLQESHQ
jgi:hypothetical protein